MIEDTIVEALASACSLTLSVDIWGGAMPTTQSTGVCVELLRDVDTRLNVIGKAMLAIHVVKASRYDCRVLAVCIATALNAHFGLDTWSAESISTSYKGVNTINNHLYVVYVSVHKE